MRLEKLLRRVYADAWRLRSSSNRGSCLKRELPAFMVNRLGWGAYVGPVKTSDWLSVRDYFKCGYDLILPKLYRLVMFRFYTQTLAEGQLVRSAILWL